jgi:predicted transcriptional regulator
MPKRTDDWRKTAALSIRISQLTKDAIDRLAAEDRRSTSSLVEKILADAVGAKEMGGVQKYPEMDEWVAAGGNLMDMPTPTGKKIGDLTREEVEVLAKAYMAAGKTMQANAEKLEKALKAKSRPSRAKRPISGAS